MNCDMIQPSNYWAHIKVNTLKRIIGPIQSIPLFHPPQFTETAFPSLMARSRVCPGFFSPCIVPLFQNWKPQIIQEKQENALPQRQALAWKLLPSLDVRGSPQSVTFRGLLQLPVLFCFHWESFYSVFSSFSISHVWFYSRSLGYLVFGSLLPKQCPVWNHSSGMVLKRNQALVGYSHDFGYHHSPLPSCISHAGEIVGQRFCDTIGVCISLLVSCRVPSYTKEIRTQE